MPVFPEHLPTCEIKEVLSGVFFVTGQMIVGEGAGTMQFSRNMTIVQDGSDLTLINTVRLDSSGLAELEELGTVRNVVRLGAHHGRDDAFYLNRYGAAFWAIPGMEFPRGETISHPLIADEPGPCAGSQVFAFKTTNKPEAILRLDRHQGVIITCDSLQNFTGPDQFFNPTATEIMQEAGFLKPANIGPGWRKATEPKSSDFAQLMSLDFEHVFSAHGVPCLGNAHEKYQPIILETFGV